jgi:predicted transcriptional regulator
MPLTKFRKEKKTVLKKNIDYVVNVYIVLPGGNIVNTDDHSTTYGTRIHGNVIVKGNMENALNTINNISESGAKSDLGARLKDLHASINKLIPELSNEEAETVSRDLKNFAEEVTSARPRKSVFEMSAKSLREAAETVASMTEPVTKAVKAVIDLFSNS